MNLDSLNIGNAVFFFVGSSDDHHFVMALHKSRSPDVGVDDAAPVGNVKELMKDQDFHFAKKGKPVR